MSIFARKSILWLRMVFIHIINCTLAQPDFIFSRCEKTDNYTINSTYQRNLDTTLSTLPNTNSGFGFYNFSTGQGRDAVNSIAICRGDVNPDVCTQCLNDSIVKLRKVCPNKKEAIGVYEYCRLKYSNNTLFGYPNDKDYFFQFNPENTTDLDGFNGALRPLMDELRGIAAAGDSLLKFASGNKTGRGFIRIYAIVQCTPDLTEQQCSDCLEDEVIQIARNDNGKIGGKIILPMCNFRFETYPFFNQTTRVIPSPPTPPTGIVTSGRN